MPAISDRVHELRFWVLAWGLSGMACERSLGSEQVSRPAAGGASATSAAGPATVSPPKAAPLPPPIASSVLLLQRPGPEAILVPRALGAEFYFSGVEFWSPTEADARALEAALPGALRSSKDRRAAVISSQLGKYRRQYVGTVHGGKRRVFGNFFCEARPDWKERGVFVKDGGDCYFQVQFEPGSGDIVELNINGEA